MKITIENHGKTTFVDLGHDDFDINELVETLHSLMFILGYHQDGIRQAFKNYAKELN